MSQLSGTSNNLSGCGRRLSSLKRLVKVGNDIVNVLDTNRDTDKIL
jgi:hypothetical protein